MDINQLNINAIIGFSGTPIDSCILHPDNEHLIFPLGTQIIVRNILTREQRILKGHSNNISKIAVSNNGKYLASGQTTFAGFKADVIIWDFQSGSLLHRLTIHKEYIQSLSFSFNDKYLVSLGGISDNYLIIWDVVSGKAVCGNEAGKDFVWQVKFCNTRDDQMITCQNYGIKLWKIDYQNKKMVSTNINFGNLKRQVISCCIDLNDKYGYFGTKTGDILEICLENCIYKRMGPLKRLFSQGINVVKMLPNNDLIVGTGEGVIAKIGYQDFKIKAENKLMGAITSITLTADSLYFFAGTDNSNIYWCESSTLHSEIRNTCHYDRINDIRFPYDYSDVFGTCSKNEIRVWNSKTKQELLRIFVPNIECFSLGFLNDGKSIYSGWQDGKIRCFYPQSGKLQYVINDAHINGVTCINATSDNKKLISGGMGGEIRVWKLNKQSQEMDASLKEHRSRVWSIVVNDNNDRAISASGDGSCIIWDIKNYTRIACAFENTMFKELVYHPMECQFITAGSDRKVAYWDAIDAVELRMMEGTLEGEINSLDMTKSGEYFISAGEDKQLKIWDYDLGDCQWLGVGHSDTINKCKISPNQEFIVTVGNDGSIFFWETPLDIRRPKEDKNMPK